MTQTNQAWIVFLFLIFDRNRPELVVEDLTGRAQGRVINRDENWRQRWVLFHDASDPHETTPPHRNARKTQFDDDGPCQWDELEALR